MALERNYYKILASYFTNNTWFL